MASIFTKIIQGEISCYKIAETEECIAFLDAFPLVKGHVLVVPKREVDNIFDLDDALFAALHIFSKKIAQAVFSAIPCAKVGISVVGLEVPHAHIHLIPINQVMDMNFSKEKIKIPAAEMQKIAEAIAAAL